MFRDTAASREARHRRRHHRALSRDLGPHLMRDIGLDPWPEDPPIPPFAALPTRL